MTSRSRPSRKKASQILSWVWNGKVVEKRVMYHFVAYDEVEIISRFCACVKA